MQAIANAPRCSPPPDSQPTRQLSNLELRQEADGLFAGITYLNQTEQIEDTVVDVDDDDDETEEEELPECCMVSEFWKKKPKSEVAEARSLAQTLVKLGYRSYPQIEWSENKCLSSCRDYDDCCRQLQQRKTSNCPAYLLCHWIEVHGETTVLFKDTRSFNWLCPVPSCGSSFTSKPDLLRHIWDCNQIDTLTDFYWCNAHNKFEVEVFYSTCGGSLHRKSLDAQLPIDFSVLIYKLTGSWPDLEFQPDPQFCPRCEHSNDLDFFTPEEVIDHILYHQTNSLPIRHVFNDTCLGHTARSIIRDISRCDPTVADILDLAEARIEEHLISKFTQFLESLEVRDDGIYCERCRQLGSETSLASYQNKVLRSFLSDRFNDVATALQHFSAHPAEDYIPNERRRRILASPHIQISFRYLKCRQQLFSAVKQLQEEVNGSRSLCEYLSSTVAPGRRCVGLMSDMGTLLASVESRLPVNPTSPLPGDLWGDLEQVEKIHNEYWASPKLTDLLSSSQEIQLPAPLNEKSKKRKLRALLGRISSPDKSDQVSSRDKQWANLRSLRLSSSGFRSQILSLTSREGRRKFRFGQRMVIRRLRQHIKSSSDFLVTGILTFRDILQGSVPSTLEEVLAFVSLSHVMSEELWCKGSMTKPLDFNAGFPRWMCAIRSEAEQAVFQELATCLWPGSALAFASRVKPDESVLSTTAQPGITKSGIQIIANYATEGLGTGPLDTLDFLDQDNLAEAFEFTESPIALEDPYVGVIASGMSVWKDVTPGMLHSSQLSIDMDTMMNTTTDTLPDFEKWVQELLGQSNAFDDFHFSDFLDPRPRKEWPGQTLDPILSTPIPITNPEAKIVEIEAEAPVAKSSTNAVQSIFTSESPSSSLQPEELVGDEPIEMVEAVGDIAPRGAIIAVLWATAIFQVVLTYMDYVCGLGDLLTYFAGNFNMKKRGGVITSASPSLKENSLPILAKVLHPLLIHHELGELKHVVGVTSAALQQGFFTCLREVEDYMVHLARLFARSKSSYMVLVSKSLKYMRSAALAGFSSINPCACRTEHSFYDGKEIKGREAKQARWASERFNDCYDRNAMEAMFPAWSLAVVCEETPSISNTKTPSNSIDTWESNGHNSSREDPVSALSAQVAPQSEAPGPAAASSLYCDACRVVGVVKSFSGPDAQCNLRRHMREKHEGKKSTCPSCDATFSRLHNLRTHWTRKHKGVDMPASLETRSGGRHVSHRVSPY